MNKPVIPGWVAIAMITTAFLFDTAQFVVELIPLAGQLLGSVIAVPAFFTFLIWFKMYDVSFVEPKRALVMGGGLIIEVVPLLGILPGWTVTVALLIGMSKAEALK